MSHPAPKKKSPAQLQREIDEALRKGPQDEPPSPVDVGDFVSFKSKHDGSTIKGRVVEVAWLGGDHWSAMVKMAGRPGNAIVRADELTKLPSRSHSTRSQCPDCNRPFDPTTRRHLQDPYVNRFGLPICCAADYRAANPAWRPSGPVPPYDPELLRRLREEAE